MALIFLVAIVLRTVVPNTERQIVAGDEETYHFSALNLVHHHTFTRDVTGGMFGGTVELVPTANLSPGFSFYIAAIYAVLGEDPSKILVSNVVLSIISFWLIYRILRTLRASSIGLVTALGITAVYPGFLYNIDRMLTEQLFVALFLGATLLFLIGTERQKRGVLAASGIILAAATHVRAQAIPFIALALIYLAVYANSRASFFKMAAPFTGGFILCMAPWWIRNFILLGEFVPLTLATDSPRIWGAVPYFLDMNDTNNKNLSEIINANFSASPSAYIRWRLFGYMNNMWADVWDENLTHPGIFLQRIAFVCQLIFVVPAMIAMPWLIKRRIPQWTLIAAVPLCIVLPNVMFHGLPRYAFLAAPYVIIMIGLLLTRNEEFKSDGLAQWQEKAHGVGHIILLFLASIYAVWVAYSVYIFPSRIPADMSSYRIGKYAHITVADLANSDIVFDASYKATQLEVRNSKLIKEDGQYRNTDAPGIFILKLGSTDKNSVITRVEVSMSGGAPYDYTTLYWMTSESPRMSESKFYKAPRFWFNNRQVFYIDADARELLVVPSVLQGNKFTLDSIRVTKYRNP